MSIISALSNYLKQPLGAIAPMFGLMAPLIFTAVGGAIDFSHGYLIKQRLTHALDAAALAGAAIASEDGNVQAKVEQFLELNYPTNRIGNVYEISVQVNGDEVTASAKANYDTYLLHLIGLGELNVYVNNAVEREVQGIEIVLVLDVTGSMAEEIGELEESVEMFVERMCGGAECPEKVKIGYVPFSTAVNVGPYGLGENEDGSYYDTPFVNNPFGKNWNVDNFDDWRGCVAASESFDTDIDYGGNWNMYRNSMAFATSTTFFDFESYSHYDPNNRRHYYHVYNHLCNRSFITPLTNDKTRLLEKADFQAEGWTLGNLGMVWGLRVLLPYYPFTEGAPWSDNVTKRVIVMMTDGRNDIPDGGNGASQFSAYGPASGDGIDEDDLNAKFSNLCEQAKDDYDVDVYTITFSTGVDAFTETLFENCASAPANYYDVDDANQLSTVYDKIAKELSNLRIKN